MNRTEILQSIRQQPVVSVLVVGGGINGIGTFRDLALQGVDVLLVERGDFCSGASAASSHMAHGGIRYLENGEFRLVREAVHERNRMIRNAPHLVRPLPTSIPMFRTFSGLLNAPLKFLGWLDRPAERGGLVIKIGLLLYDAYTGRSRTVPRHTFVARRKALERFPRLSPTLRYLATYYDGSIFSPERLALEILLDGEREGPHARALNYVALAGQDGSAVTLRDELDGRTFQLQPKLIINAAGPWIDAANSSLNLSTRYIGGTKGSHLVLDHPELRRAIADHEFFFENKDGRIVLIFPLGDKVMVGTSDLPVDDPDNVRCTTDEVEYFIEMIGRVFPEIRVAPEHIVFRFSGVRPLAYTRAKNAGQITRDHHIHEDRLGSVPVLSLVGGKWTSYRAFSEQVTDRALALLDLPRKSGTRELPIGGGEGYEDMRQESAGSLLFERYGSRAREVAAFISAGKDSPLKNLAGMTRRELSFLAEHEKIVHLDDLVLRRTMLAFLGQLSRPLVEELAEILAESLGWSTAQRKAEVTRCLEILADRHEARLRR
jgi:glycerol-3-phosphate dehydrogenase